MVPALPVQGGAQVPAGAARERRQHTIGLDRRTRGRRQVPSVLQRNQLGAAGEARGRAAVQATSRELCIHAKRRCSHVPFDLLFSVIHSTRNTLTANSHANAPD